VSKFLNSFGRTAVCLTIVFLLTLAFPFRAASADNADFSGTWELTAEGLDGQFTWILTQNGTEVTGLH
jgi:hypothetical protein